VGKTFGDSRERLHQIEAKAQRKVAAREPQQETEELKGVGSPFSEPIEYRIVCLLWRPNGGVIRDGGFRRTYAILESIRGDVDLTLVDRYPSFLQPSGRIRVIEYRIPQWISRLEDRGFALAGALEAGVAFGLLLVRGGQELRRARHRVLYVPTSEIPWVTFAAAALARLFHCRLVLANLNTRIELTNKVAGLVGRLLWKIHARADRVIALSTATADELRSVGVVRNVSVNSCGFERPPNGPREPGPRPHAGVYVGRIESAKGVADLLDTWFLVNKAFPTAVLRLAGHATSDNWTRFVRRRNELGLDGAVQFLGVVSDDTKWSLLRESRVCLFLSHVEGWGFVPLEAVSLGVPVIVYDLPCYRESLRGLRGVLRVALGDTRGAANQVAKLLAMSDSEYKAMSDEIESSFGYPDWSHVALTELELIEGKARSGD